MEQFSLGYTLHFDNISIGRVKTVNDLGRITVNPIPYRFLTGLKILRGSTNSSTSEESWLTLRSSLPPSEVSYRVEHPNPSYYQINLRLTSSTTPGESASATSGVFSGYLVLSQSFDKGWKAYSLSPDSFLLDSWYTKLFIPFFAKEMDGHVLVNNWANGWLLSPITHLSRQRRDNPQLTTTITIVYLPQYLEYLGFAFSYILKSSATFESPLIKC